MLNQISQIVMCLNVVFLGCIIWGFIKVLVLISKTKITEKKNMIFIDEYMEKYKRFINLIEESRRLEYAILALKKVNTQEEFEERFKLMIRYGSIVEEIEAYGKELKKMRKS